MNYRLSHAADDAIELTQLEEGVLKRPTRLFRGQRDQDTGWLFEELKALGEHESTELSKKVKIVVVRKSSNEVEVRPGPLGYMNTTETVNVGGLGGEGRHTYSGATFSELSPLAVEREYRVKKKP